VTFLIFALYNTLAYLFTDDLLVDNIYGSNVLLIVLWLKQRT